MVVVRPVLARQPFHTLARMHQVADGRKSPLAGWIGRILLFLQDRRKQFCAGIRAIRGKSAGGNLILTKGELPSPVGNLAIHDFALTPYNRGNPPDSFKKQQEWRIQVERLNGGLAKTIGRIRSSK